MFLLPFETFYMQYFNFFRSLIYFILTDSNTVIRNFNTRAMGKSTMTISLILAYKQKHQPYITLYTKSIRNKLFLLAQGFLGKFSYCTKHNPHYKIANIHFSLCVLISDGIITQSFRFTTNQFCNYNYKQNYLEVF